MGSDPPMEITIGPTLEGLPPVFGAGVLMTRDKPHDRPQGLEGLYECGEGLGGLAVTQSTNACRRIAFTASIK